LHTGEVKIITRGGNELAILKYVVNAETGEGCMHVVESHARKILPGVASSKLKAIMPKLSSALDTIVRRTGGKWVASCLKPSGGGIGAGLFGGVVGALLDVLFSTSTCHAAEMPKPRIIQLDPLELGLNADELSALSDAIDESRPALR
jgi:hypothetical protein